MIPQAEQLSKSKEGSYYQRGQLSKQIEEEATSEDRTSRAFMQGDSRMPDTDTRLWIWLSLEVNHAP